MVFLSNLLGFGATTIAAIYKDRWAVELFFKALKQTLQNQDVCGNQRQCGEDPSLDGADRDAGAEVPAVEITVFLVVVDSGGFAAAAIVLLVYRVGQRSPVTPNYAERSRGIAEDTLHCCA